MDGKGEAGVRGFQMGNRRKDGAWGSDGHLDKQEVHRIKKGIWRLWAGGLWKGVMIANGAFSDYTREN